MSGDALSLNHLPPPLINFFDNEIGNIIIRLFDRTASSLVLEQGGISRAPPYFQSALAPFSLILRLCFAARPFSVRVTQPLFHLPSFYSIVAHSLSPCNAAPTPLFLLTLWFF